MVVGDGVAVSCSVKFSTHTEAALSDEAGGWDHKQKQIRYNLLCTLSLMQIFVPFSYFSCETVCLYYV